MVKNLREERLGEIRKNNSGSLMEITEYKSQMNLIVKFENGYTVKSAYKEFKNGSIRNPYDITHCGVGYLGEGDYLSRINKKPTPQYDTWSSMIKRCYSEKYLARNPTYEGCTIAEEWLNFQNFANWYDANYYTVNDEKMSLDKDILIKGNKVYSPETCLFVPQRINTLFLKTDGYRGSLPIGVSFHKQNKTFIAHCNKYVKTENGYIGSYNTPEEAFTAYKTYKESIIQQIANEYIDKIPNKLYCAMIKYKVDITD